MVRMQIVVDVDPQGYNPHLPLGPLENPQRPMGSPRWAPGPIRGPLLGPYGGPIGVLCRSRGPYRAPIRGPYIGSL